MEDDPFNNPDLAHPRARELMKEEIFWNCGDEAGPFGSDEGWDAFYEWREWRVENPDLQIIECFNWILRGQLNSYNSKLATAEQVAADLKKPRKAFLAKHYDMYTMDATIIATGLGQLIDEGIIDPSAKPFIKVATARQRFEGAGCFEKSTLDAIDRVVDEA